MINIIIFSKDRACQLHYLLETLKLNFKEYYFEKIKVIYKYKNQIHQTAYDILKTTFPEIEYFCQNTNKLSFKDLILQNINENNKLTVFFVDDMFIKNRFSLDDAEIQMMNNNENACVSLRMNDGMNYCQPAKLKYTTIPTIIDNRWKWRGQQGDWGYPMSLDGHIFRTNEIKHKISIINFENPTYLESHLSGLLPEQEYMICYKRSIVINNPMNRVHNFNLNPCSNISEDYLCKEYLDGKKLKSTIPPEEIINNSPHYQLETILY